MDKEQKHYEFSKLVFKTAWADTLSYFGWNKRTIVLGLLWVAGGFLYYFYAGEEALTEELVQIAVWGFAPVGVFAFLLFLWNVAIAPFKLVYEKVGAVDSSKPAPANTKKKKLTLKERFKYMAETVYWLKGELEESSRYISIGVTSDVPPKIDSVFIDLRKLGLDTPYIPRTTEKDLYYHLHLEYLKIIHPYMQALQVKEARAMAKKATKEILAGLEERENDEQG